jgi:hypothetical protein
VASRSPSSPDRSVRQSSGPRLKALVAYAALAAAIAGLAHAASPAGYDFVALYAAARLVATGRGAHATDAGALLAEEQAALPERTIFLNDPNLPAVALLMAPLGALPYWAAYLAMLALSTAALAVAAALLAPLAGAQRGRLLPFALLGLPSVVALVQGQTTPLVLCAVAVALRARPAAAGAILGATALRLQLLPLHAVAALGRGAGAALPLAVCLGALALASFAAVGGEGLARWPDRLAQAAAETGANEVSLPALARRAGVPAETSLAFAVALTGLAAIALLRSPAPMLVAAGPLALLAAPHALLHDLLFAYAAVATVSTDRTRAWAWAAGGTAAMLLQLVGVPAVQLWLIALAGAVLRLQSPRGKD